jgi:hypothetical protein
MPDLEVTALSENEMDYSDYFQVKANTSNILVLLSGFTFTGITILLGQFPILGSLTAQFAVKVYPYFLQLKQYQASRCSMNVNG